MKYSLLGLLLIALVAYVGAAERHYTPTSPSLTSCAGKPWVDNGVVVAPSDVDENPRLASSVNPYPDNCPVANGLEGDVIFVAVVDGEGRIDPSKARLVSTAGPDFTRIALDGFPLTRFWPACKGDEPVATRIKYRVHVDCRLTPNKSLERTRDR